MKKGTDFNDRGDPQLTRSTIGEAAKTIEHEGENGDRNPTPQAIDNARRGIEHEGEDPWTLPSMALDNVVQTFQKWLHLPDLIPLYTMLGTIAANRLPGDPVWLGLIAPPSSAKTELLNSVLKLPNIHEAATLTPASLLSGTPKNGRAKDAKGGLLRQIGNFGILISKDFTSVLSMRPDAKAELLAALRELYDGRWTRQLGTEGGRTLFWQGKLGFLFGCTEAIDDHHSVMSELGARFLLCRLPPGGKEQLEMAWQHAGAGTTKMRGELAEAVTALFALRGAQPPQLSEADKSELAGITLRAVKLRSAVVRDRHSREIEAVHNAEGPARLGLTLERLIAGLITLGIEPATALGVARRVADDSVPLLRRRALEYLEQQKAYAETSIIAEQLGLPKNTVRRALEDLAAHRLAKRHSQSQGKTDLWEATT